MAAVRNRDSTAELAVRRRLWANGLRFRVRSQLLGKPDIVFSRAKIVVFIDGDFWHGNAWRVRGLPSFEAQFKNRSDWWVAKIQRTMERDREVTGGLVQQGWTVLRYWESETLTNPNRITEQIATAVRGLGCMFTPVEVSKVEVRRLASVRSVALPVPGAGPSTKNGKPD